MKKIIFLLLIVASEQPLFGQLKNDCTWILGYPTLIPGQPNTEDWGGMYVKFTENGYTIENFDIFGGPISAVANDEGGNLLFYSNGCSVFNKQHQVMENGDDINVGASNYEYECEEYLGLFYIRSGNLTLPMPGNIDKNFLVHLRAINTSDTSIYDAIFDRLLFTEIDVQANNSLGKVLQKNQTIVADSLHDAIAAVRHGNGRDWWIVMPRGKNRQFWKILLTPEGFKESILQTFPPPYPPFNIKGYLNIDVPPFFLEIIPDEYGYESWAGQATFSPDGAKYCRVIRSSGVEVFDFDRCSGEMTFRRYIPLPPYTAYPDEPIVACGLAISPNSRYLYFNNNEGLYQFDLCEDNIENGSYELIAEWDRFLDQDFFATNFFQMRNAPDGKIYINSANTTRYIHVIHEPNKAGQACNFEQRGVVLPRWSHFVINNFPNFRLYDLPDSPCDTLGIDDPNPSAPKVAFDEFRIFPNPANHEVMFYVPQCEGIKIKVWNVAGQAITEIPFVPGMETYQLDVSNWAAGAYIIAAYIDAQKPVIQKLTVAH
jgi:hypothetical protein